MQIRPLQASDHTAWLAHWQVYCGGYDATLDPQVTAATWQRILDANAPIHGLAAVNDSGELLGFCHFVCHPHTWSAQTICYLEDLFVSASARRLGVASALIEHVRQLGIAQHWFRVYWITDAGNAAAQAVYDKVATRTDYVRYEIALGKQTEMV